MSPDRLGQSGLIFYGNGSAGMTTAYITHQDCCLHQMGSYHPESPERLQSIQAYLQNSGLLEKLKCLDAQPANVSQLQRVHPATYIANLARLQPQQGLASVDPDTSLCPQSIRAAELAAGAVVMAVDGVCSGQFDNAFCAVRPPGHHAERQTSMGFCLFNNVAVGVAHAQHQYRLQRVAILDFDVHHGNGTVDIFKDEPSVLLCSSFQHPFYPGRFTDIERPNIVNTPLVAGTNGEQFRRAIERDWLPALELHRPEIIFVSAGFDAHRDDPLGGLELLEEDYAWVTRLICDAAERYTKGRLVSVLEGGYDLDALAASVGAHIEVLLQ